MAIKYDKLVTQSIAKQISENIREAILQGHLKVDERLPTEEELAQRFSVSRPTIREALKRLAAQNLIRSQRGPTGGTFVKKPSREELSSALTNAATLMVTLGEFDLEAIVEARREMEQLCLKLAVQRRTADQLTILQQELANQRGEISDEAFCASDIRFHRAIVDGCGNPILQFNMYTVIEALQPLTNMVANRFRDRQRIVDLHQQLYAAIEARQSDAASTLLDQLIDYLRDQYAKALAWQQQKRAQDAG